jgi:N-acyl-D-aspartate/D-glutamate deacylase
MKVIVSLLLFLPFLAVSQNTESFRITNVRIIDGTGVPARKADVRVQGDQIVAVGNLEPLPGETLIDGQNKILAPGFIDTHSHHDRSLFSAPEALAVLNQGITTIVAGQDGYGWDIDTLTEKIKNQAIAINIAVYTGHTHLREKVLGEAQLGRPANFEEIREMGEILKREMDRGSLGLSTGLEYAGAYFSSEAEVIALAKVAGAAQGRYISHLRSEDIDLHKAIEEIITIGREAQLPVQISHFKIALKDDWGTAPFILARLQQAREQGIDITADCYPYDFWSSTLKVLFPKTDYTNRESAEFAVHHTIDASKSILSKFAANPDYKGKTLSEVAALRHQTEADALMALIAEADAFEQKYPDASGIEGIMGKSMIDEDIINLLAWNHTNICSDGANGGHPRGYGSFTRVLGHYVREKKIMSWETAINKMTALAAEHVGIKKRGLIAPGYFADLVLFDPETVKDNATVAAPQALSDGIFQVWVNGISTYEQQKPSGKLPGRFVQR